MTILATDNFTRSDETPLSTNWANGSGVGVCLISNKSVGTFTAIAQSSARTNLSWPNDQYSKHTISSANVGGDWWGAVCRWTNDGTGTGYLMYQDGTANTVYLYRGAGMGTGGSGLTLLSSAAHTHSANDIYECRAQGTTISALVNGSVICSATDSNVASGNPGVFFYGNSVNGSFWEGGDLGSSQTPYSRVHVFQPFNSQ